MMLWARLNTTEEKAPERVFRCTDAGACVFKHLQPHFLSAGDTYLLSVLQRPRALMRGIPKRGEREGHQLPTTAKLECGLGISLLSLN